MAEDLKHQGVASCASSSCHGGVKARSSSSVNQNEYQIWFNHDAHARAFKDLLGDDAKKMAEHMGIKKAEEDPLCLSCHSTFISEKHRDEKFRLEDGVGCESCHGPSEEYLKSHTQKGRSHQDNVDDGMTDLYNLESRAKVCLDCHAGNKDKTVDHRLIGSGHPRLSFDLDTYGILQPRHWSIDKDYTERKGTYEPFKAFLIGQIERSIRILDSLERDIKKESRLPELSNFYCYNCHHSLANEEWKVRSYNGKPGELKLNLSSLFAISTAISTNSCELASTLHKLTSSLSHEVDKDKSLDKIDSLKEFLENKALTYAKKTEFTSEILKKNLSAFTDYADFKKFMPYEVAEQYAMGVFSILSSLDPDGKLYSKEVKAIHKSLENEKQFNPEKFSEAMKNLNQAVK